ncbi:MAG TPA: sigma 54-interacting transcriptional regulator [Myxococcaceae bacterium]|jgi:DNA-binding NtrC family response regulator
MATLKPGTPLVVGRRPPSDICLRDAKLSREHARFRLAEDCQSITVEDLGSTNGTWLGTQRIQTVQLSFGQEVRLGEVLARPQAFKDAPVLARTGTSPLGEAVVAGKAMRELKEKVEHLASSRAPLVLRGEAGTGKKVLAGMLHMLGPNPDKPLVPVYCGTIPPHLGESMLVGHERGAVAGAIHPPKGAFEVAHGGTVFLDELAALPLPAQSALLRVLETGRLTRVGSTREIPVDVRVIAATHWDLEALVQAGQLRQDLYSRLRPLMLELPPLRERKDEIEPLALHFLRQANLESGGRIQGIAPSAMELLLAYAWPGNVRELRNVIGGAVLISRSSFISVQDLPARVVGAPAAPLTPPAPAAASTELRSRVQQYEARLIRETLEAMNWNRAETARVLKMPLRTLAHKIKSLRIKKDQA